MKTRLRLKDVAILVVDDNEDALMLLEEALWQFGAVVKTASNGWDAIDIVQKMPLDILISDITMPGMDGLTLIREIRKLERDKGINEGSQNFLPAIALTALASARDFRESAAAGFQIHVAKPVNLEGLLSTVALLAGRR